MLRQTRRVVCAALLALAAFAGSAAAECAWVFWTHYIGLEQWEVSEAHPTLAECQRAIGLLAATMTKNGYKVTQATPPYTRATVFEKKDADRGYLVCLPDTIDPRGPKGGGR